MPDAFALFLSFARTEAATSAITTTLIKAIASLGHALIDNNDTADALSFLEYGISIGSDISSNYIDLAIIYAATDRFDDIRKLKEKAGMLKSLSRDNIIEQLNNMLK